MTVSGLFDFRLLQHNRPNNGPQLGHHSMSERCQERKSANYHFLILVEHEQILPASPLRTTGARSSSSLERFPRSLIGAIEGSARFRQSCHECGP